MSASVSNMPIQNGVAANNCEEGSRAREIAQRLVRWKSETGTPGEAEFAACICGLLREIPYFRNHPDNIRLIDSHGDPMTRSVAALVRGNSRHTLVLAGHFDTASIDNYRDLKDLACESETLQLALISELSGRDRSEQEERALADLLSGDFLPGRGMLDMKSGIAAAVACLERFAACSERHGNLLLVVTPDEERESRGMRSLRDALPKLASELGLTVSAGINLDVTSDQGDGEEGRSIYAGTIGKLLPFALVIGCSSHASYPFEGISAQAIAASILKRVEGNATLADRDAVDISPPPICLEARDLRDGYEVTTPERFWIAFNWLYHAMTASELFERFQSEVLAGAEEAVGRISAQAADYGRLTGKSVGAAPPTPRQLTFRQLRRAAARAMGEDFERLYAEQEKKLSVIDNPLAVSRELTEWLVGVARLSGPAIIVGFAGLHYPSSRLDLEQASDRKLKRSIDEARGCLSNDPKRSVTWKAHFQGISDMSFLGRAADRDDVVSENTPISRLVDRPSQEALRFPVVNIGPWGREFHQRLERVHAPYAFDVLPRLVSAIAERFLRAHQDDD